MLRKILLPLCLGLAVIISCEQDPNALQRAGDEVGGFGGEEEGTAAPAGIVIASPPETLYYALGQEFDPYGLAVDLVFDDGSSRPLEEGEYQLAVLPPDMGAAGPKQIEVRAGEFIAKTPIIVNNSDSVLASISASPVGGAVHRLGESFKPAALNVTGTFANKNGNTEKKNLSVFSVQGYDKDTLGEQTVTVSVNGKKADAAVEVRIPADAVVLSANTVGTNLTDINHGHNTVFIKGQNPAQSNVKFRILLKVDGANYTLFSGDGIEPDDISLDTNKTGMQTATVTLDDKKINVDVYVADIEPEVYFDYGFWRHESMDQPDGYHTVPGKTVTLSPVRVLIGYDKDNKDIGAEYTWAVTPQDGAETIPYSTNKEFISLTPNKTGKWNISVTVTGRNFINGETISKTADAFVICDAAKTIVYANPSSNSVTTTKFAYHPAPSQFTEGGTGYGWSLGTIGGYLIAKVPHANVYKAEGNAFGDWVEPGMVWFQEDLNGNDQPDEVWYEAYIGPSMPNTPITRNYSVTFFKSDDPDVKPSGNTYGQIIRTIYWADCKGRTGKMSGGWPGDWGVSKNKGAKVIYTCTLASDDDRISIAHVGNFKLPANIPFADYYPPEEFPISMAVAADGSPVKLTNVRFVKVHTAVFQIGDVAFGEISTEAGIGVKK
jgi:hypothetical protein